MIIQEGRFHALYISPVGYSYLSSNFVKTNKTHTFQLKIDSHWPARHFEIDGFGKTVDSINNVIQLVSLSSPILFCQIFQ